MPCTPLTRPSILPSGAPQAAPRAWLPRHCGEQNLQGILAQAHQIASLLHGPVEALLQQVGASDGLGGLASLRRLLWLLPQEAGG